MATEILRPNADGDVIQCSPIPGEGESNWEDVDEVVADDGDTLVNSGTSALLDLYNLPVHSGSGTINKITVHARILTGNPEFDYGRIAIKTGGTIYYSGNLITDLFAWENKSFEWTTNPQTTVAWTWDNIDALQIGIELTGTAEAGQCTQLYVEVEYTETGMGSLLSQKLPFA